MLNTTLITPTYVPARHYMRINVIETKKLKRHNTYSELTTSLSHKLAMKGDFTPSCRDVFFVIYCNQI